LRRNIIFFSPSAATNLTALLRAQARPVVVVIAHLSRIGDAELVDRLQALGLRRDRGAADRVQVHHARCLGARLVDGAVDDPARRIDRLPAARLVGAGDVDLEQVGGGDLLEQHAERNEEKAPGRIGQAARQVRVDQVVHAAPGEHAVAGGELAPRLLVRRHQGSLTSIILIEGSRNWLV
jgi:hypothetical protein